MAEDFIAAARAELSRLFDSKPQPSLTESARAELSSLFGRKSATSYKDASWDSSEAKASAKTGVPVEVIRAIRVHGEKSNSNQVSPKGARGVYQFIPSTRNAFLKKYGVDAYSQDPDEQALAAAHHLKESYGRTKDWARAVAGYNGGRSGELGTNTTAENVNYVKRVMGALPQLPSPIQKADASDYEDAWANDKFDVAMGDDDQTLA